MNYLLIDTSYLIFYRYYAIIQWWKHAKSDVELPANPYESKEFVDKFTKTFLDSIKIIKKKLNIDKSKCTIIAARDCPRKEIWRNSLYTKYKEQRYKDDEFMGGEFFKLVYNENYLKEAGIHYIIKHNGLEADDIIAITKNYIRAKYQTNNIYIITNDHDFLQLKDDYTHLINLKFKNLYENRKVFQNPQKNLFFKIILGDKSDNIEPVFKNKKCGPKTVEKYFENPELFEEALKENNFRDVYELNKKLVCFSEIPNNLIETLLIKNKEIYDQL